METPADFEVQGTRGFYRPRGVVTLEQALQLIYSAVRFARAQRLRDILININALEGYREPTIFDRYEYAGTLADIGAGHLHVAQVLPADVIDAKRFGVLVATNRELITCAFVTEEEAIAWLNSGNFDVRPQDDAAGSA